jgi:poly(A) polymerase
MPKLYSEQDHHIRNDLIDPHALSVLRKLHEAGHRAYLVGGSVRDLLMKQRPKDFDISTSAHPEEIKEIFRNCILVGRRFRLAHIRFGKDVIEVSTFRSGDPMDDDLIVRDNIWGTPEEDVLRRDFTINGLFYDPLDHTIIDFVGGFEDLKQHHLRVIGDPLIRFRQDPVRMIRMQKFRARFGFYADPLALDALAQCRNEITKSAPARVLEEILRMLESGSAEPFFRLLMESSLLEILFPTLSNYFHEENLGHAIFTYLKAADSMNVIGHYRTLDRSLLIAALIFPILEVRIETHSSEAKKIPHIGEIIELTHQLFQELLFNSMVHFPRRLKAACHFILQMQYRLTPLDQRKALRTRLAKQKEFLLALTFLKMRALVHHKYFKPYEFWKQIHRNQTKGGGG